jgi:hypothetical protein
LAGRTTTSFAVVATEIVAAASVDLDGIGSALTLGNVAATPATIGVVAAAEDEVSLAVAALFSDHGQTFQQLSSQASAWHAQFVQAVNQASRLYASAEAANASPLQSVEQDLVSVINAPTQELLGRPLIGNGANGTATNPDGGAGGILFGNGGNAGTGGGGGAGGGGGTGSTTGAGEPVAALRCPKRFASKIMHSSNLSIQTRLAISAFSTPLTRKTAQTLAPRKPRLGAAFEFK